MGSPNDVAYDFSAFLKDDQLWERELDCFCSEAKRYAKSNGLGLRSMRAIFDCGLASTRQAQEVMRCIDELGGANIG
jgi:hypothetical protein